MTSKWLTVKEYAEIMGVSACTVRRRLAERHYSLAGAKRTSYPYGDWRIPARCVEPADEWARIPTRSKRR